MYNIKEYTVFWIFFTPNLISDSDALYENKTFENYFSMEILLNEKSMTDFSKSGVHTGF